MKSKSLTALLVCLLSFLSVVAQDKSSLVKEINQTQFATLVSNYNGGFKNWHFNGDKPVVIDFYATWCGPCRKLSPIIEELAKEYKGKIDFYKIDVDKNPELSKAYQVATIPMVLLCPAKGMPQPITGLYPKEELVKAINYVFWPNK